MFCPKCGIENVENANFCTQCGQGLSPGSEVQQYQQPVPPQMYQQESRPDMKETFKQSAVSGAGTYAGCCIMNALSNMLCDACE